MIVDTSAFLSVALQESDGRQIAQAMSQAARRWMSAASYLEAGLKLVGREVDAIETLDGLVQALSIELIDVTPEQAREAVRARARFGRPPARLNFGDCLVYALAKTTGDLLLFKGEDFTHTDLIRVQLPG